MLNKKKKNILITILWLSIFIVFVGEIIFISQNKKDFDDELKKFYILQSERDRSIREKEKIIDELPNYVNKIFSFSFFILAILVHIRFSSLIKLYQKNQKDKTEDVDGDENKGGKSSLRFKIAKFLIIVFISRFFLDEAINFFDIDFDDLDESEKKDILRKPISMKKRIERIFYKIYSVKENEEKKKLNELNKKNKAENSKNNVKKKKINIDELVNFNMDSEE